MKKKKAFAFDFDGTLTLSFHVEDYCMTESIRQVGYPFVTEEIVHQNYGPTEDGIIAKLVDKKDFDKAWEICLRLYKEISKDLKPFEGIPELLEDLSKKGVSLFLLTGRSRQTLDISLHDLHLEPYFKQCYTGSRLGTNKEISMKKLCEEHHYSMDDVLYIGDTLDDIRMMNSLPCDILSAGYSHDLKYQSCLEEKNPGRVVSSVKELHQRLTELI